VSTLRTVVVEWLEWGLGAGEMHTLTPAEKREFVADVIQSEPDWLFDAFSEWFMRNPGQRAQLAERFREGDFLQVGAMVDRAFISYVTDTCADYWLSEFTQIGEQISHYAGDE
jgi:hypothetical protein